MEIAYFKDIRQAIINSLLSAKAKIQIAVCWFTNHELFNVLCDKLNEKGFVIELIILNDFINNRIDGLEFQKFIDKGGILYYGNTERPIHNKYCIIDDKILINGSYNWTYYAENRNEENIIIHFEKWELIKSFSDDFCRLKELSMRIVKVNEYSFVQIAENNVFGTHNYLAHDYLYEAYETKNPTIVEKAFQLIPTNIDIQKKAVEYNFNKRKWLKNSIGESIVENRFKVFIPIGTEIPCSNTQTVTTTEDYIKECKIVIKYGESLFDSKNIQIGCFTLKKIPPMKAGEPKFDTTFAINIYGILIVSMHIRGTNNITTMQFDINNILEDFKP